MLQSILAHWLCLSLGALVGIFIMALCIAAGRADQEMKILFLKKQCSTQAKVIHKGSEIISFCITQINLALQDVKAKPRLKQILSTINKESNHA